MAMHLSTARQSKQTCNSSNIYIILIYEKKNWVIIWCGYSHTQPYCGSTSGFRSFCLFMPRHKRPIGGIF